jgi:hypothetical protein
VSRGCVDDLSATIIASCRALRSSLKPAINGFKSLERVQQLEAGISHLIGVGGELFSMFYDEPDPIDSDACLVRHFEFHRRWPGTQPILNQREHLFSKLAFHVAIASEGRRLARSSSRYFSSKLSLTILSAPPIVVMHVLGFAK